MALAKALKTKWIAALRSGKYKQGRSTLIDTFTNFKGDQITAHCCLGVLCEVATGKKPRSNANYFGTRFGLNRKAQLLLAGKNDNGLSFKRIATYIEKNL